MYDFSKVPRDQIGDMIRFHRKKSGLTRSKLGELAEVGKTAVFDIEQGKTTMRMDTLLKILSVLNIAIAFASPLMRRYEETQS